MVVLAAAVVTKAGKALVSRQFREMPRSRIEGLLASFPKLISSNTQHTTVETDSVRYVYQPLEALYMVIITNKASNIVQDIETLHLFARVVADICRSPEEKEIVRNAFELIIGFDEVVNLGYRENLNLQQIRTIIEMDSHEERIQEIIARNKEQETKEIQKRKAKQIEMQKREAMKRGGMGMGSGGMGNSFGGGPSSFGNVMGPGAGRSPAAEPAVAQSFNDSYSKPSPAPAVKGMQLGRKTKASDMFEAIKSETNLEDVPTPTGTPTTQPISRVPMDSVHVQIEEKIILVVNRDGGVQTMEVKGDLTLRVTDPEKAKIRMAVLYTQDPNLQLKTHPNVNRNLFQSDNVIALKDTNRPFPVNQPTGVLRWRYAVADEGSIPLSINCWPTPAGDGSCDVNIEYELENESLEFTNVLVSIPVPPGSNPRMGEYEGACQFNRAHQQVEWQVDVINQSNPTGVIEFNCPGAADVNAFFPVSVSFQSGRSLFDVDVSEISQVEGGDSVSFSKDTLLVAEEYSVV